MDNNPCIIITSINGSEKDVLRSYAQQSTIKRFGFIIAGDTKTPKGFNLPGCEFLSIEEQRHLPFKISQILPDCNYAKKNVAYLQAIKKGYNILIETDDDNMPLPEFWEPRVSEVEGSALVDEGWVNVYKYFSDANIWPRGFSYMQIKKNIPEIKTQKNTYICPIQQGLADENPDVDAFYRLVMPLPIYFNKRSDIILGRNAICPFNSQNTTWFKKAFPLLYLPSYCSFRMTDIWRSFVAQRILWTCDWNLSFHNATVSQKRNEHDLMKDMEQEITGYLSNEKIVTLLNDLELKSGEDNIFENMRRCYKALVEKKYFEKKELPLLEAWIYDLETMNY